MPPASGIKISDDVRNMTKNVIDRKLPYVVLKFSDNFEQILVEEDEKFYSKHFEYSELLELLPKDSPRYVLYDYPHLNSDRTQNSKVVLVSWIPKQASSKARFACPSTVAALKAVTNIGKHYVEGELDDVDDAAVCDRCQWERVPDSERPKLSEAPIKLR